MKLQLYSSAEVRAALPMAQAVEGMKQAFAQMSAGQADVPLRTHMAIASGNDTLVMPAHTSDGHALAVKVVSVFNSNGDRGLPLIHALVLALDEETGQPLALMEGGALTAIRTGAASGAATDILARPDASVVALFGSGVQARTQLEAVCTVRQIEEVRVFSRSDATTFIDEMVGRGPVPKVIRSTATAAEALNGADIVCAATTSRTPVFNGTDLQTGVHINAVGSYTPQAQEIDTTTIQRALVVVDSRPAALEEAGDLIIPLSTGLITLEHIHAELGEIILGKRPGRTNQEQITFFKSVGLAIQDAIAAQIILTNGPALGLGQSVNL